MELEIQKNSAERKLQKVKINLTRNKLFASMSGLIMTGTTTVRDDIPTAMTDGYNEAYGRKFTLNLQERELGFVVIHENFHKLYRHLTVWQKLWKKNKQLANAACDYQINLVIQDMDPAGQFIVMPRDPNDPNKPMGLIDERFRNMHVKQIFDILEKEQKERGGQPGEDGGQPGEGQPGKGGFDEHDWEAANAPTAEEAAAIEQEIDRAIRQGKIAHEKANGRGNGSMDRLLNELLTPKVNWRELLREFVSTYCAAKDEASYRRLNRRFVGLDIYLPIMVGETIPNVVLGVDMSGSISGEIPRFLTEMVSLLSMVKPETVDLLYWDSHVTAHETYTLDTLDTMQANTKPKGGGGTTPSCVSSYLRKHRMKPDCIVMLTDGEVGSDWGHDWPAPVLWLVVNSYRSPVAPNGKTISIGELD